MASQKKEKESKKEGLALFLERVSQGPDAVWTKEELTTCVHWQKQLTAALIGLAWGLLPLKGFEGFAAFALVQAVCIVIFYRLVLRVNEEMYGGVGESLVEGFHSFFAVFMLAWVLVYNLAHVPMPVL
ncbi:hypothetical protein HYH03_016651 [Edaphochlamys debaryana]|uniref:Rab5-interacting protein n=1 Tax=Edaphochlamys debaryana TaxID=47281 RepID=A0A835XKJ2_9CHLO|nr:hypothetical protein HYH03_016651 [Edaphochlamys debaryana]|eukprot:KAG2484508.1 hypothetical protein HYH03_016651 [Edaphochlamys debaryana]